jgi:ethanolaminephosphotransferase
MNDYLVEFFPTCVAPNLITLLTLLMVCAQHFVFMWPRTGEGVEDWKLLMMGVCIVLYQHLDTLDGKQARRTSKLLLDVENSSPLGMLFDHGSDSLITFMITSQLVKIIGITPNVAFVAYYALVLPNIFCAMWLQYAIGYFFLGRINPIDEGLPFTPQHISVHCQEQAIMIFMREIDQI